MLERALSGLFDFQRFEKNPELQNVIDAVTEKYAADRVWSLADEDLAMAAGGFGNIDREREKEPNHDGRGTL